MKRWMKNEWNGVRKENYYHPNLFIDQNGTEQMTINLIYILSICTFWFLFDFIKCAEENNKKYIGK